MQKREQGKHGGSVGGGSSTPAPKRGRPIGSGTNSAAVAAVAAAADSAAPHTLLGPTLQVHSAFAGLSSTLSLTSPLSSDCLTFKLSLLDYCVPLSRRVLISFFFGNFAAITSLGFFKKKFV